MSHSTTSKTRATLSPIYLLANGSATGNAQEWPGGEGAFLAEFTGGAVSLEFNGPNPDTDTWIAVGEDTTLAASGGGTFKLPAGTRIRAAISGGATSVYAIAKQID